MEWWQVLLLVQAASCSTYVAVAVARNMLIERRQRRLMARAGADNAEPLRQVKRPKVDRRIQRRRSA